MKYILIASVLFGSALSSKIFASSIDVEQTLIEHRWYSFNEVIEKRKRYKRVDISLGYIEHYFEDEEYSTKYPEEERSPLEKFYSNHGTVGTHAAADYETALDRACIDVVSNSIASFEGSYENRKRSDRQQYKRMVVGIRSLTFKGPEYNFKGISSWSPVESPKDKRSLLCEIYEVKSEVSDYKYIVYAASVATAMFDEIDTAPLPDNTVE